MKGPVYGKILCVGMMLALALAFSTMPAAASAPADVTIVSEMSSWPSGTFYAYGPAVNAGIVCPSGDVYDVEARTAGKSSSFLMLFVHKHFQCGDESGSFEMDLDVRLVYSPAGTTAQWRVVAGDGAYARLRGNGKLTGSYPGGVVTDTYTGGLHTD